MFLRDSSYFENKRKQHMTHSIMCKQHMIFNLCKVADDVFLARVNQNNLFFINNKDRIVYI